MKPGQNQKMRMRGRMNNGGKRHMPMRNQTFDSSGPDIRVRGNAHQVLEKYLALARDASAQGDRIAAENYYQHAEHYFRTINSQNQNQQRFNNNNGGNGGNGQHQQRPMATPADDHALLSSDLQGEEGDGEGEDEGQQGGGGQTTPMNA